MDKRFQVFVSSTFRNLKKERETVMKKLLEMNLFPAGMEIFPAADDSQIKYIKKIIDDSDYFIVIVAGKYGTINKYGISYTEMEFNYALEVKKPILSFLFEDINSLRKYELEDNPQKTILLEKFRKKLSKDRMVKFWKNKDDLGAKVVTALTHIIKSHPMNGWIRNPEKIAGSNNDKLYMPSKVFNPVQGSSIEFNEDLTQELKKSRMYIFRGVSGKRCSVRLKYLKNNPNDILMRFIMPHPFEGEENLIERISHRMRAKNNFNYEEELKKIQYEIPMSIVALWSIRYHYKKCEIVFQKDTSISRVEIFDGAVYNTLYDSNLSERRYNPPIIKFDSDSLFYEVYRKEVSREFEKSFNENNCIIINKKYSQKNLIQDFIKLNLGNLNQKKIDEYLKYFGEFEIKFIKQSKIDIL